MPLPSPPFHEPEAIKHPVADGKEPSIGEILPVILGPNITGSSFVVSVNTNWPSSSGCVDISSVGDSWRLVSGSSVTVWGGGKINASRSSLIYGNSTTVQPNSLVFNYIVKY